MMRQRLDRHDRYTKIRNLHDLRLEKMKLRELMINQELAIKDDFRAVASKFSFISVLFSIGSTIMESLTIFNGLKMGMKAFSFLFHSGKKKRDE